MNVITRFAPSPTGYLHIGSARTALFNYLFARHHNGKFLLRIEDTDFARSTPEACEAIIKGMEWLGIDHDGEIIYQSKNAERHKEVAYELLAKGAAYKCYLAQEEIDAAREEASKSGKSFLLNSPWRDSAPKENNDPYVIRIKAPRSGYSVINDIVQGEVKVPCDTLDDMVLLRSDGTPTYMLAVVVDDHDAGVTHIIRGDDHLNNGFRQKLIYEAMGWDIPVMGHIPLIHGPDGAKLSKRHGALGVEAYRDMGYLPDALFNYLVRLGWSHGDDEIISLEDAIKWFDGTHIGKGPARLDFAKMTHVNSVYLRAKDNSELLEIIKGAWAEQGVDFDDTTRQNLEKAMDEIKVRATLCTDLAEIAKIYHSAIVYRIDPDAKEIIDVANPELIQSLRDLVASSSWQNKDEISAGFKEFASARSMKLGEVMSVMRAMLTGKKASPSVFEIMEVIGKEASLARMDHARS